MRKYQYHGKISYTIKENHPDIKCVEGWTKDKIFTFEDTYYFTTDYTEEEIISHIKYDLKLVASGGYRTDYIDNVTFEIKRA